MIVIPWTKIPQDDFCSGTIINSLGTIIPADFVPVSDDLVHVMKQQEPVCHCS